MTLAKANKIGNILQMLLAVWLLLRLKNITVKIKLLFNLKTI